MFLHRKNGRQSDYRWPLVIDIDVIGLTFIQIIMCFLLAYHRCHWLHLIAERNLNPKAACLKRREEEKAEDGPKLPQHHMLSNAYPVGMSASNISFDF